MTAKLLNINRILTGDTYNLKAAYWMLSCVVIANLIWIATTRVTLKWSNLESDVYAIVFLAVLYLLVSKPSLLKTYPVISGLIRALLFGLIFLQCAWVNMRVFNHLMMTTALPWQDALLMKWDEDLGADWLGYFRFVHDRPWLITLQDYSYTSLTPLSVVTYIGLILLGFKKRAFFFVEVFFFTAVTTALFGALFPAKGAVDWHMINLVDYPNFGQLPGVYHLGHFNNLRMPSGQISLDPLRAPGLVTFPSFHTAAGIIMCAAVYRTWLFIPVIGYVMLMISATPIFGGHYFIDLIAGTILAIIFALGLRKFPRYRDVWKQDAPEVAPKNLTVT